MKKHALLLAFALLASSVAQARNLTPAEKLSDLDQLMATVRSHYGPLQYKKTRIGLNLDKLRDQYATRALATSTNGEFYYLMREVVAEFQDSHFGIFVPTSRVANLPFTTDLVGGKVLIDTINRTKLPEATFPYQRGDEIVRIGGEDTQSVLDRLQKQINSGYALTARRSDAFAIPFRRGERTEVPSGEVVVSIRRGTSNLVDDVKMTWEVKGDGMDEFKPALLEASSDRATRAFDYFNLTWTDPARPASEYNGESSYRCSGTTRIEKPTGTVEIMNEPFVAYYFPTPKGNVGYLRIPHYAWGSIQAADGMPLNNQVAFKKYEYAVSVLEKNTVGLIIDQDHNCGGSVEYLEDLVGQFMGKDYQPMSFELLASKGEYIEFKKWHDEETPSDTLERAGLAKVLDLIKKSWMDGLFLTPKTSIHGKEWMRPNAVRYSKPIVMMIDELSGSGGDAFPSLMQGYGRAKLVGTRTMGAGGHVVEAPRLNYSQMTIRLTKSLFYRPDGVAVENNGAEPDYPYAITREDFMYGYRNYRDFTLSKLFEQL